jgi:hypothetical protein
MWVTGAGAARGHSAYMKAQLRALIVAVVTVAGLMVGPTAYAQIQTTPAQTCLPGYRACVAGGIGSVTGGLTANQIYSGRPSHLMAGH